MKLNNLYVCKSDLMVGNAGDVVVFVSDVFGYDTFIGYLMLNPKNNIQSVYTISNFDNLFCSIYDYHFKESNIKLI